MNREKNYTSTSNKLMGHLDRLQDIKKGIYRPINLQLSPTNKCNLNCEFCSVKNRKNLELSLSTCIKIIDDFHKVGPLLSVEITGGGEPTLYPYLSEIIAHCYYKRIKVGLITNGLKLDILDRSDLNRLEWLRISLNGIDYKRYPIIPKGFNGTLGFSYVWNKKSNVNTLKEIYNNYGKISKYIRIVPDCLDFKEQTKLSNDVKFLIEQLEYTDKMFIQSKSYEVYRPCNIGGLKPYVYTDGYVYHCSAVALYNRDFDKKWRICHHTQITEIWPDSFPTFHAKFCRKGKCFYSGQNKILNDLTFEVEHHGFI